MVELLSVDSVNIPGDLRKLPWVCWKAQRNGLGKVKKVPVGPSGRPVDVHDERNQQSFDAVIARYEADTCSGIGFVLTGEAGLVAIDLDGVVGPDGIAPQARAIVERLDSYTELSPSGTGLHIVLRSDRLPALGDHRFSGGIEVYWHRQYMTATGRVLGHRREVQDRSASFESWYDEISGTSRSRQSENRTGHLVALDTTVDSREIVDRLCRESPRFRGLYLDGDIRGWPSQSEAEMSIAVMLTDAGIQDHDEIQAIMQASALYRTKHESVAYMSRTISKASGYSESRQMVIDDDPHALIEGLRARLSAEERLRAELGEVQHLCASMARNRGLRPAMLTAQKLFIVFRHYEGLGAAKPYKISISELMECTGTHRNTVSNHLKLLSAAGLIDWEPRSKPSSIDPDTGEMMPRRTETYIAPVGSALEFARSAAKVDFKRGWGGDRVGAFGRLPGTEASPSVELAAHAYVVESLHDAA